MIEPRMGSRGKAERVDEAAIAEARPASSEDVRAGLLDLSAGLRRLAVTLTSAGLDCARTSAVIGMLAESAPEQIDEYMRSTMSNAQHSTAIIPRQLQEVDDAMRKLESSITRWCAARSRKGG